jgi:preprotein translocase subunit SecA
MSNVSAISHSFAGAYPERIFPRESWFDRLGVAASGPLLRWQRSRAMRLDELISLVEVCGNRLRDASDDQLAENAMGVRHLLRREGLGNDALVAESFALVREVAQRRLGVRHYDVQLIGGLILLRGMVAEMEAGEGKTLTATLPACTAALAGIPVHIITVNDYLASRDTELMRPVYEALGLSVGTIIQGMMPAQRQQAYACDITYCTNKEVAFDYLKDRIALGEKRNRTQLRLERLYGKESRLGRLLLRGLHFGIVDEADSALIDEARTPLIISGASNIEDEKRFYEQALLIAGQLREHADFEIIERERRLLLTEQGKMRARELSESMGGLWRGTQRREELVRQALTAQHLYIRDRHYIVREGKVQIVDEYTGRVMPDRSWEQGLHQMIERKEDCDPTQRRETLARISYQRFFRRYLMLAGMTGTAKEVRSELWSVYRLPVVRLPTNRPVRRKADRPQVHRRAAERWAAVANQVATVHAQGRPVLVGTRSVQASEHLSRILIEQGLDHELLNARQDENEAKIVARAGESGRITIATNMAGRGTDIKLSEDVTGKGGLHVIMTELHEARRIDRQLIGRCARQGDPGSYSAILSLEDDVATIYCNKMVLSFSALLSRFGFGRLAGLWSLRSGQRSAERMHSRIRRELVRMDERLDTALAFAGHSE